MKDIMLKITGKTITQQNDKEQHEDVVELTTEGKLFRRGQTTYVSYMESEISGLEGCKTSLVISNGISISAKTAPYGLPVPRQ